MQTQFRCFQTRLMRQSEVAPVSDRRFTGRMPARCPCHKSANASRQSETGATCQARSRCSPTPRCQDQDPTILQEVTEETEGRTSRPFHRWQRRSRRPETIRPSDFRFQVSAFQVSPPRPLVFWKKLGSFGFNLSGFSLQVSGLRSQLSAFQPFSLSGLRSQVST